MKLKCEVCVQYRYTIFCSLKEIYTYGHGAKVLNIVACAKLLSLSNAIK